MFTCEGKTLALASICGKENGGEVVLHCGLRRESILLPLR